MPRRRTIADLIIESFAAADRRVIVADWRIHVAYMRIAYEHGYAIPDTSKVNSLIQKLLANGQLEKIQNVHGVFRVVVPYALNIPAADEIIIQEANPKAVFSHLTAFAYHELTDEIPATIYLYHNPKNTIRIPLGTSPDDWVDVPRPPKRTPPAIRERPIVWSQIKAEWDFGHMIGYVQGLPIYITDLERTLIDSLRFPDKCGGLTSVFRGWNRSADKFDIDRLIDYTERIDQSLLRQRVGFVLEHMKKNHTKFENWIKNSIRGSSAKLSANEPFSSTYSERWNLSINVPESLLVLLES